MGIKSRILIARSFPVYWRPGREAGAPWEERGHDRGVQSPKKRFRTIGVSFSAISGIS